MWSEARNRLGFGRPLAGALAVWMACATPAILSAVPRGRLAVQTFLDERLERASAAVCLGGAGSLDAAIRELKAVLAIDPKLADDRRRPIDEHVPSGKAR